MLQVDPMPIERVATLDDVRLTDYRDVPDPERLRQGEVFVAEGRQVVRVLLTTSPYRTRSILVTDAGLSALSDAIQPRLDTLSVYVVEPGVIEGLTGFNIHRGCLAIGERPSRRPRDGVLDSLPAAAATGAAPTSRLVVLEQIANADNVGGIFRNAAAFGCEAVVLGPRCCDPLYRKAIRVSMGAALRVPFVHADDWPHDLGRLRQRGFTVAGLTPRDDGEDISTFAARLDRRQSVAVLVGAEGDGLSDAALIQCDAWVRIPMAPDVDSLNVATATGIALHCLGIGRR
jgi:tRNA G18 (ribose-2'-O)-methylase SpoU